MTLKKLLRIVRSIFLFERANWLVRKGRYEAAVSALSSIDKVWKAADNRKTELPAVHLLRTYAFYKLNRLEDCRASRSLILWQIHSADSPFSKQYGDDSKAYIDTYLQLIVADLEGAAMAGPERKPYDIHRVDDFLIRNFPILA